MAYTDAQLAGFLRKCRAANREKEQAIPGVSEPNLQCTPKTASAEQMERFEQVIRQQRIAREKGGWRASAKWLAENFPEDFKEPIAAPGAQQSCDNCPNSEPVSKVPVEPHPIVGAPESPQSAPVALPAPSRIPLASAFWQALLYGSRDALVSPGMRTLPCFWSRMSYRLIAMEPTLSRPLEPARCERRSLSASEQKSGML